MLQQYETRKNTVVIESRTNKGLGRFTGLLKEGVEYSLKIFYDTLFKDFLNWRNTLNQIIIGAQELLTRSQEAQKTLNNIIAGGLSWTRKIGGMPEYIEFQLPVRIWLEDSMNDITEKLNVLYNLAVPEIGKQLAFIEQHEVIVMIGDWFLLEQCIITGIGHKWSETLIKGFPAWCDIDIGVSTVYAVGRQYVDFAGGKVTVKEVREGTAEAPAKT